MRYGDKGEEVERLQKRLLEREYELPRYGADGHFGSETWATLRDFARDHGGLRWNPEVPPDVLAALFEPPKKPEIPAVPAVPAPELANVKLYDLRGEQTDPPAMARKFKLRGGSVVKRNPASVNAITVHQTAVEYGVAAYQIKAAGGDSDLALARRSLAVACHVMAYRRGFISWPNPLEWYVYHGNGFNSRALGIEIDGNYSGVKGGPTWNGKPATTPTPELIRAACAGIELLVREGRAAGMPIKYIHAHRQSSETRRSDPGEELWQAVVIDFAVPVLGLETQPDLVVGSGRAIPKEWDQNGVVSY
jgi:hypothetical protein